MSRYLVEFCIHHTAPEVGPVTELVLDKESNLAMCFWSQYYQHLCGYSENPKVLDHLLILSGLLPRGFGR